MKPFSAVVVFWTYLINRVADTLPPDRFNRPVLRGSSKTLPAEIHNNHIYLRGRHKLRDDLSFILDTGADFNGLNADLIDTLGVRHKFGLNADNAGTGEDPARIYLSQNVGLEVGGVPLRANIFAPLEPLIAVSGRTIDGILGAQIFYRCVVEIDYLKLSVTLHPSRDYRYSGEGALVPIELVGRRPFIRARVKFPGIDEIEGKFVVDTGDSSGLSLHTPFVQEYNLLEQAGKVIPHFTHGIAGESREFLGRSERFDIGPFSLKYPVVALSQAEKGSKADKSYDGAIGGEILRRFKVILDYSRKQMILEPNANLEAPFEVDMSGAEFEARGERFERIFISRVNEDTPASESGLQKGDEILEMDGERAGNLGLAQIKNLLKIDGREIRLKILRGEEELDRTLLLCRLV